MENSQQLREKLEPIIEACGVKLYEIKWLEKDKTLQIAIMRPDGSMDLDTCADVSQKLSDYLDANENLIPSAYTLEVCSPGAEREIKDLNELKTMDHPYVYLRLKHPAKKMLEFTGTVVSDDDGTIRLEYRDKAATRYVEFAEEDIDYIRLAVKF